MWSNKSSDLHFSTFCPLYFPAKGLNLQLAYSLVISAKWTQNTGVLFFSFYSQNLSKTMSSVASWCLHWNHPSTLHWMLWWLPWTHSATCIASSANMGGYCVSLSAFDTDDGQSCGPHLSCLTFLCWLVVSLHFGLTPHDSLALTPIASALLSKDLSDFFLKIVL